MTGWRAQMPPTIAGGELCESCDVALVIDEANKRIAELEAQVADLKHWAEYACETPDPKCDCPGCSLARESFGRKKNDEYDKRQ